MARLWLASLLLAIWLHGCAAGADEERTLSVFAAASLTEVFERLGRHYEEAHPGVDVEFQFAGSQQLVAQLDQGASADVLVTADGVTMARAVEAGLVRGSPAEIARNRLTIAVAAGNPKEIRNLADLARPGVDVALAAPEVPAGRYSRLALSQAAVAVAPVTEEPSVKAVLTKVELGEVDAGIVYVSDLSGRDRVEAVGIPDPHNVEASYLAATTTQTKDRLEAQSFLSFLNEGVARNELAAAGFGLS